MDTAQWPQEIGLVVPSSNSTITNPTTTAATSMPYCSNTSNLAATIQQGVGVGVVVGEKRVVARPQKEQALHCPRCNSTNTKFCYYNNYSLTQPRYFCKTCRRYWTEGGSLRNVPVGGGSRKNKQHKLSSSSSSSSSAAAAASSSSTAVPSSSSSTAVASDHLTASSSMGLVGGLSAVDLLRSTAGMMMAPSPFMGMALPMEDAGGLMMYHPGGFRSAASVNNSSFLPMDGVGVGYSNMQGVVVDQECGNGRLLFPFEDLRQQVSAASGGADHQMEGQNRGAHGSETSAATNGFWGGGSDGAVW